MPKNRLEAFSDGVIAILITIMVLELKLPHGDSWSALASLTPVFVAYVLSFVYLAIYWNNHHHMLHATHHVTGRILWSNNLLLFWLSLVPFVTAWMGENHNAPVPTAAYGVVLLMAALSYNLLLRTILATQPTDSELARAVGRDWKGYVSLACYLAAIPMAFVNQWISDALYFAIALLWFVPDRRMVTGHATHV